jgi:hypothetical protein
MANITPDESGVNFIIWISTKNANHGPRIKVFKSSPRSENFSVSITDDPKVVAGNSFVSSKDLKNIIKFILINKDVLLDYWNAITDNTDEVLNRIKHI